MAGGPFAGRYRAGGLHNMKGGFTGRPGAAGKAKGDGASQGTVPGKTRREVLPGRVFSGLLSPSPFSVAIFRRAFSCQMPAASRASPAVSHMAAEAAGWPEDIGSSVLRGLTGGFRNWSSRCATSTGADAGKGGRPAPAGMPGPGDLVSRGLYARCRLQQPDDGSVFRQGG